MGQFDTFIFLAVHSFATPLPQELLFHDFS